MKAIMDCEEGMVKLKVGRIIIDPDKMISAVQIAAKEPIINSITHDEFGKIIEFLLMIEKRVPGLKFEIIDNRKPINNIKKKIISSTVPPYIVPLYVIRLMTLFFAILSSIFCIAVYLKVF